MCEHETLATIRNRNETDFQKRFKILMVRILALCNIKNQPDVLNEGYLMKFIYENSNCTFEEIEKAVYFNQAGKLSKIHEHFQVLDVLFLGSVLTDYFAIKNKTRNRIAELLPPKVEKPVTPEESYNGLLAYCKKHGLFPDYWSWQLVYDHMMHQGVITESKDERWDLYYAELEKLTEKLELEILNTPDSAKRQRMRDALPEHAKQNCIKSLVQKHLKF